MATSEESEQTHKRALRPQVLVACACWLVGIAYGMSTGHSAVLLPHLRQENDSGIEINDSTESWIASVYALASPAGCLLCGFAMDFWGRRKMNILGTVGMIVGWVIIMFANNVAMLILGRVLEGFFRSVLATSITVLIDELADPKYRGFIVCSIYTFVSVGITVISSLGAFLHWRSASGLAASLCVIILVAFWFVMETPTWLMKKSRVKEAERTLQWLWGPDRDYEVQMELADLQRRLHPNINEDGTESKNAITSFFTPRVLKPFFILHVFNVFQAFCGLGIFTFYTVDMISKTRRDDNIQVLDDFMTTIVVSIVRVLLLILSSVCMIFIGRRILAVLSGIFSSISVLSLGLVLLLAHTQNGSSLSSETEAYLIFILLLAYAGSMSFGFFALPSLMLGETQASHVRGFTCGYIFTINDLLLGAVVKFYPWMITTIKIYGVFFSFGVSCVLCTMFVYLFLPETQGLTLTEIEDYFKQENVLWITRHRYIQKKDRESAQHDEQNTHL